MASPGPLALCLSLSVYISKFSIENAYQNKIDEPLIFLAVVTTGWDWDSCAKDDTCARWCIKLYMQANEGTCASDLNATVADLSCHHYGRLLDGGSGGCSDPGTCPYVTQTRQTCYPTHGGNGPFIQGTNVC